MTWPAIVSVLLVSLILIGGFGIGLTGWYWSTIGRWASDVAVKVASVVVKLIAGSATVGGAYAAANKDEWLFPAIAGLVCIVIWEVLEKLIDNRVKAVERIDKLALIRAEQVCEARTELLTVFRRSVAEKTNRLLRKLPNRRDNPSAALIRSALTPDDHLGDLLLSLAVYFSEQLPADRSETSNFRVGLYVARDGGIEPLRAVNLNNPSYDVFSSYRQHRESFRLNATERPSHAVNCINRRQTIIVEDCEFAAAKGEFHFFNDNQRGYLRSMLAYYLDQVCCDDGTPVFAALIVDTDSAGFFRETDRDALEFCLREFGTRVKLELLLHSMLVKRERPHEDVEPRTESPETGGTPEQAP
jgi:hypothetical protein